MASATQRDEILEESNVSEELFEEIKLNEPPILSGDLLSEQNASVPSFDWKSYGPTNQLIRATQFYQVYQIKRLFYNLVSNSRKWARIVESISEQDQSLATVPKLR